jgi:hypothetical protein
MRTLRLFTRARIIGWSSSQFEADCHSNSVLAGHACQASSSPEWSSMLKAMILTTIIGLFTATRTIPIWTSVLVILLLVSAEVIYLGLHHHFSVINDLADLGVLNSIGQISYLAGVFLLA